MPEKISIYYDRGKHGDLKGMLARLRRSRTSSFYDRSESEIARMLLEDALKEALGDRGKSKLEGGGRP